MTLVSRYSPHCLHQFGDRGPSRTAGSAGEAGPVLPGPVAGRRPGHRHGHPHQAQEVPLALADPPADGGQFHRPGRSRSGAVDACSRQITAHLTVAYTSHHRTRSTSTGPPAGRGVGGQKLGRARRIRRPGPGHRIARPWHTASRCPRPGLPRWASSQSSTPAQAVGRRPESCPSGSHRGPRPDSPTGGSVASQPPGARARGRAGARRAHRGDRAADPAADQHSGSPGTDAGSMRVDGGQGPGRLVGQGRSRRRRIRRRGECVGGSSRHRAVRPPATRDRSPSADPSGHHSRHRDPGLAGRPQQARLHPDTGALGRVLRRDAPPRPLQDQGSDLPRGCLEIEGAGDPGRPAREAAHPCHPTAECGTRAARLRRRRPRSPAHPSH